MSCRAPWLVPIWACLALAGIARADADEVAGARLRAVRVEGCPGLPFAAAHRELWSRGDLVVDAAARFWTLDRPAAYEAYEGTEAGSFTSRARYRMGAGVLRVDAVLSPELDRETVQIVVEREVEPEYLRVYLPGVSLPCVRTTEYVVQPGGRRPVDLSRLREFDETLHAATERIYDGRLAESRELLERAMELRPDDPTPHWMLARLVYLELEQSADTLSTEDRIAGYERADAFAQAAIDLAPEQPEGYLWQAIAQGRVLTARGSLGAAMSGMLGGRGPRWLEQTLRRAVSLPEEFSFFGDSTRGDALYALAQLYRIAPDAWYMGMVGMRGDIDRSVELLREATTRQPTRIEYQKELAVALLCRDAEGDPDEARLALERALALPAITPIDAIDHAHAQSLLDELPARVCAYSRDGFLELRP